MRLVTFLASLLTLTFTISARCPSRENPVAVYENADEPVQCCADVMNEVRASTTNIWIHRANIFVIIGRSDENKDLISAGVFGCYPIEAEKMSACVVIITPKMLASINREELFATLAHEASHIAQRGEKRWREEQISFEYEADAFSMQLLKSAGKDPWALVKTLRIILQKSGGLSDDDRKMISDRIARAEKLLTTN